MRNYTVDVPTAKGPRRVPRSSKLGRAWLAGDRVKVAAMLEENDRIEDRQALYGNRGRQQAAMRLAAFRRSNVYRTINAEHDR